MNLDTTKRKVDNDSHSPLHQADEQDTEIQVIVTLSAVSLRSILKPLISNLTENRSPPRTPPHANEIRAAMTSSPSSPQSPEHPKKERTKQPEISNINVPDSHKAGDSTTIPANQTIAAPKKNPKNKAHQTGTDMRVQPKPTVQYLLGTQTRKCSTR